MKLLHFSTDALPPEQRLPAFRQGAFEFEVDAVGDPLDFTIRWDLLRLGAVDVVRTHACPIQYRRTPAMIDPDHQHRVTFHFRQTGHATGFLGDQALESTPGSAAVWDLAHPLLVRGEVDGRLLIVNIARHLLDEVLPRASYVAVLPPSPAIAMAAAHVGALLDDAEALPEESAPAIGRVIRDLVLAAMLPAWADARVATAPVETRLAALIDRAPRGTWTVAGAAAALDLPAQVVADHAGGEAGLAMLVERRRLLTAYRLLCDPTETASISGIAHACGFDDLPRFSRQFRAVFGDAPSGVRARQHGQLPRWAGSYMVERHYAPMRQG